MKERFLTIYANLPIGIRNEIIYVDKKWGSCTWYVIWLEVKADTDIGKEAAKMLSDMKII